MFGDVNISAILDSFSSSYDKRVRPNYGGECTDHRVIVIQLLRRYLYKGISRYIIGPRCA